MAHPQDADEDSVVSEEVLDEEAAERWDGESPAPEPNLVAEPVEVREEAENEEDKADQDQPGPVLPQAIPSDAPGG